MNTDEIVTASSISFKIYTFFVVVLIEIICNALSFFYNMSADGVLQNGALNSVKTGNLIYVAFAAVG